MYPTIKALHIIFFTAWFAGLFYVVRLFIYNTEARATNEPGQAPLVEQLSVMQRRLWFGITWPAMVGTGFFGGGLGSLYGFQAPWLLAKLAMVAGLVGYHLLCGSIHKGILAGTSSWTSNRLRMLNEVATLFLVSIVFLAVFKHTMTLSLGLKVLGSFAAVLVVGFVGYRQVRQRRSA